MTLQHLEASVPYCTNLQCHPEASESYCINLQCHLEASEPYCINLQCHLETSEPYCINLQCHPEASEPYCTNLQCHPEASEPYCTNLGWHLESTSTIRKLADQLFEMMNWNQTEILKSLKNRRKINRNKYPFKKMGGFILRILETGKVYNHQK